MKITGWKALAIMELAAIGAYALGKEVKDAYFKYKLAKGCEELAKIGEKLTALNEGIENKEEEVQ